MKKESTHDLTTEVSTLNRTWFVVGKPTTSQSLLYRDKFLILLILLLSLILRLVHLDQSLWLDEAISALAAKDFTFISIVTDFIKADNHPPLFYLTARLWGMIVGFSDVALRLMSVIFGVLTVFFTYLLAKRLGHSNRFATTAAILMATSPLHVYYSQELRMYPMITLESVITMFIFTKLIGEKKAKIDWIFFSIMLVILAATDYITLFFLPIFPLIAWFYKKDFSFWRRFFASVIPLLIFGFLWLPFFIFQSQVGRNMLQTLPGWAALSGGASIKEIVLVWMKFLLGRISFDNKIFYYTLILIASLCVLPPIYLAGKHFRRYFPLWIWLTFPLIFGFLASFIIPAFTYFRFIFCLPAFYLIISAGIKSIVNKKLRTIFVSLILLINLLGLGLYFTDPVQQRENWKQAVQFLEIKGEVEDIAIFENPEPFAPFRWYSRGEIEGFGALQSLQAEKMSVHDKLLTKLASESGDVYYFSYLKDLNDPSGFVEQELVQLGYQKKEVKSFNKIGEISRYVKAKVNSNENENRLIQ